MVSSETLRTNLWADWEAADRDAIRDHQGNRLAEQVRHVYENAEFFRELYDDAGLHPSDVTGLDDLDTIPTFDKGELREYRERTGDFWCGTRCVPESEIKYVMHSTGTTGKPNFFGLTADDEEAVKDYGAAYFYAMGLRKGDIVSMVGLNYWHGMVKATDLGAQEIGATPVRAAYQSQDIASSMFELQQEADFAAIPVFQPEVEKKYVEENDVSPSKEFPGLKFTYSGVDASDPKYEIFKETWGVPFRNSYCSGDQLILTYPCDHEEKYFHVPEKYFMVEVLDPETDEPVEPGERGEIFVTNLWSEANPYIRYRLEDLVEFKEEPCECGRTSMRVRPVGRLSWSLKLSSREKVVTNIEVEDTVWSYDELYGETYQLVQTDPEEQDQLHVRIATDKDVSEELLEEVEAELEAAFGAPSECTVIAPGEIGMESTTKLERVAEEY